jgi:exopolysaccharide biosynthesis protein
MKNRQFYTRCLAIVLLFSTALAQGATIVTHPYLGVTYINRTDAMSSGTVNMHIALIDLTAPGIHFAVTSPGGTRDTVRQTTKEFLDQQQAQVAINGNFFLPYPSADVNANAVGLVASNGNVFSAFEPQPIAAGYTDQSYAIVSYAPALNIDGNNNAAIVHRDSGNPDNKHVIEPVTLWNSISGNAQIVTNGMASVPVYRDATHPDGLLTPYANGTTYDNGKSWYDVANARTAVGLTQDDKILVLFTADKAGGSAGMKVSEVASLLIRDYQVYSALNLDGGGSTTMAMRDPTTGLGNIVNVSADNLAGRAVATNLAVFARVPEPGACTLLFIGAGIGRLFVAFRRKKATHSFDSPNSHTERD